MTNRIRAAGALALALASFPALGQGTPAVPESAPRPPVQSGTGTPAEPEIQEPAKTATPTPPEKPPAPAAGEKVPGPVEPTGLVPLSLPLFGSSAPVTSGTSFNPAISVIPDVVFYRDSENGGATGVVEEADGFHGAHAEEGHAHGGLSEGFNLRETEIAFTASVDPYFDAAALFAASEEGLEAEEVWVASRRLPAGLRVKVGKFLSGIGYANSHHPHQWDFVDQNLAYTLLLGDHGLNEKGLQLTWLPKLPFYLQLGAEILQGENEKIAAYLGPVEVGPPPVDAGGTGPDRVLSYEAGPRLFTGFVKVSPDLGYDAALQLGASYARSTMHQELHDEDEDGAVEEALEGTVDLLGIDAVFKLDSARPNGAGDLVVTAEYLRRVKELDVVGASTPARFVQDGVYAQAVWGVAPRWQLAARFDAGGLSNSVREGDAEESFDPSRRFSAALTFNPTEFSRIRTQYTRGDVATGGVRRSFDQVTLQIQVSVGAHGVHPF